LRNSKYSISWTCITSDMICCSLFSRGYASIDDPRRTTAMHLTIITSL
jgi:hypothetical protein